MLNLYGQIGVLYQDNKQVAGVYNWEIHCILEYTVRNGYKDYKPIKKISATSYWITEPVTHNEFYAEFYEEKNGQLILMDVSRVIVNFPDLSILDKKLDAPIKMEWLGSEY